MYFFSVVDVIQALTDSKIPKRYWTDLKRKMISEEGSKLYEKIVQLKMKSSKDGKMYLTDTLDTEGILRLIESVISKENNLNYKYLDDNKLLEKGDKSSGKKALKSKI